MAFRQNNKDEDAHWLHAHRHELLVVGVPARLVDDKKRWGFLLWHGAYDGDLGWDPQSMSVENATMLLELLNASYPGPDGPMLVQDLRRRLGKPVGS